MYMAPTNTTNWQNLQTSKRSQPHNTAGTTLVRQSENALSLGNDSSPAYANVAIPGTLHSGETLLIDRSHMGTLLHGNNRGTLDRMFESDDNNSVKYFVLEKPPGYNNN